MPRAARGRRHSRVGGQSCARRGLPCAPARRFRQRYRDARITPTVKVERTRSHGAERDPARPILDDAQALAVDRSGGAQTDVGASVRRCTNYCRPGHVALEMLNDAPDLDVLIVPIGGGGLISAMAVAAKAINPKIKIIGVQAELYPSMLNAVKRGVPRRLAATRLPKALRSRHRGILTLPIIETLVDEILLVSEASLEHAVSLSITIEKTVVEGAGAAGLAALIGNHRLYKGRKVGLVLCGGNIDTRLLASVLTRELARDGRLSRLAIDIPDRPGQLAKVASMIGGAGANIVEVYHQRVFTDVPAKGTELNLVIETRDRSHLEKVVAGLRAGGYAVTVKSSGGPI